MGKHFKKKTSLEKKQISKKRTSTYNLSKNIQKLVDKELPHVMFKQREMVLTKLKSIPVSYRNRYMLAVKGKSRAVAMTAFCNECLGYEEVEKCSCLACPLYPYRKNV